MLCQGNEMSADSNDNVYWNVLCIRSTFFFVFFFSFVQHITVPKHMLAFQTRPFTIKSSRSNIRLALKKKNTHFIPFVHSLYISNDTQMNALEKVPSRLVLFSIPSECCLIFSIGFFVNVIELFAKPMCNCKWFSSCNWNLWNENCCVSSKIQCTCWLELLNNRKMLQ